MAKTLDLSKSVYDLVKEYPEVIDIMKDLGFSEITNKVMLNSVGKIMTIPKGAKMKGIPMPDIIAAFMGHGFSLAGDMPEGISLDGVSEANSESKEDGQRVEQLKGYLKRLGKGEDLSEVRSDFASQFAHVDASEIMKAEQGLMKDGVPLEEVQQLCDLHSALFHGSTIHEQMEAEHAKVEAALKSQDKSGSLATLFATPGHPLALMTAENKALDALLRETKEKLAAGSVSDQDLAAIRQLSTHYEKKGDLLYPNLKVKYDISGPSMVMWTVDDDIRDQLGKLAKRKDHDKAWLEDLDGVLTRAQEMIYKEQNILFPICSENFSQEDWHAIYQDSKAYESIFGLPAPRWPEADKALAVSPTVKLDVPKADIVLGGGQFTVAQLEAMLNTMPMEVTFVDADDTNRYFNEGEEKIFKRPLTALGRKVFDCHPPKIQPIVQNIVDALRKGERDNVSVWLEKRNRPVYVSYIAVRDKDKNYIGVLELVQDMTFARDHFVK